MIAVESLTSTGVNVFQIALRRELVAAMYSSVDDNVDMHRFPQSRSGHPKGLRGFVGSTLLGLCGRRGWVQSSPPPDMEALELYLGRAPEFAYLYSHLDDDRSRELMVKLLAYRVFGPARVKLPTNNGDYWQAHELVRSRLKKTSHTMTFPSIELIGGYLDYYELADIGLPIRLHAHHLNVFGTFALQQYSFRRGETTVGVERGDTVIDAGGCWGDTALRFAHDVGQRGRVFCFEFMPDGLEVMRQNFALNAELAPRIRTIPAAVWDRSGELLNYAESGPGTSLSNGLDQQAQVTTLSIDDMVEAEGLDRVDFIKMDIEGAELPALRGARTTITRFKPKLAICAYHKPDDLITIPQYLASLGVPYKLYLDHFTIHAEETVIFAAPAE